MKDPITEEQKREVTVLLKDALPDDATIILLSTTGSRMFGWGGNVYDIDVRVVVAIKRHYWDTFHLGVKSYDCNCEELKHFINGVKFKYWTIFEDTSNPFYIDENFDFEKYQSLCSAGNVRSHMFTIGNEIQKFTLSPHHRSALHAYRLQLCSLYFLRTGKIEVNVPKINDEIFHSKHIPVLAEEYATRKRKPQPWDEIAEELKGLHEQLKKEADAREDTLDLEVYEDWKKRLIETYY